MENNKNPGQNNSEDQNKAATCTENKTIKSSVKAGISFGSCLAMIISYTAWRSIPGAILHGLLGWVYVVYYAIKY